MSNDDHVLIDLLCYSLERVMGLFFWAWKYEHGITRHIGPENSYIWGYNYVSLLLRDQDKCTYDSRELRSQVGVISK